jgi:hypothetical protein
MGLAGQNQVRQFYPGLDFPGHATITALKGGTVGDLACLSADGTVAAAGEPVKIFNLNAAGNLVASDSIKASNLVYAKSVAYTAPILGSVTFSALAAPTVGELVTVEIVIKGFGSYSPEDEYVKKAFYKVVTGDDQEAVVDGLITSLNRNFSREVGASISSNPFFAFTKTGTTTTAALVITEKDQILSYVVGKKERVNIDFSADIKSTVLPTKTVVSSTQGIGSGKTVASMEWYLKGERNDFYREAGYPHNLENSYEINPAGTYNLIELAYYDEGRDEAKKSNKQITIAMPFTNLAGNAAINLLIAELNTAFGAGTLDALAVV